MDGTEHTARRAIAQHRYGRSADVLAAADLAIAQPGDRQVRIDVRAASVNPIDWQMIEGNRRLIAKRTFPFVPLFDLAGVVTEVGREVSRFAIGDRVHADNKLDGGGASDIVNVDEDLVSHIPPKLSFDEAAAVPLAGQTALLALDKAGVSAGSRLCIIGASGGVGSFAVQIARAIGAREVIGVCSGQNADFVRSLGAHRVVDYLTTNLSEAVDPRSLDAVVDCVGGRGQWLAARRVLRNGGTFTTISRDEDGVVTVIAAARMIATILSRQFMSRFARRIRYIPVFLDASHVLLDRVDDLISQGRIRVAITSVHSSNLDGLIAALEESRRGRVTGKVVVRSAPSDHLAGSV